MGKITDVEQIQAWRKARELTKLLYVVSSQGALRTDFPLRDQIRRAAVSILSNIAEGFERGGDREFRQFLSQAKGSTGELKALLCVALDVGYVTQKQFDLLQARVAEVARLVGGFIRYLSQSDLKGTKFKHDLPLSRVP